MSITRSAIQREIASIKERFPPPPKDHTYRLLKEIYMLHKEIGDEAPATLETLLKAKHQQMHHNVKKNSFRILIELTSGWIDARLKSRYANALMFAHIKEAKPTGIIKFMKKHGGIQKCDKKCRAILKRRSKRVKAH